jgi:hypothetical protein
MKIQMTPAEFWSLAWMVYREQETSRREIYFEEWDGVDQLMNSLSACLTDDRTSAVAWLREVLVTAPDNEGVREYLADVLCWIDGTADYDAWESTQDDLGVLFDGWEW